MEKKLWDRCVWQFNKSKKDLKMNVHDNKFLIDMKQKDKLVLPRVEIVATLKCTLNCVGCSHLIDLFVEKQDFPIETLSSSIKIFMERIDACICTSITGGEPFLHPSIGELITLCSEHPKILYVDITTNATIIPKPDVIKSLSNKKVSVKVNKYPGSNKFDELIDIFNNGNVNYYVLPQEPWIDYGDFTKRNKRKSILMQDFLSCYNGIYCKTILNNRLFHCPRAAYLFGLGNYDLGIESLDLKGNTFNAENLKEFYLQNYNSVCDYCDRMQRTPIPRGNQLSTIC